MRLRHSFYACLTVLLLTPGQVFAEEGDLFSLEIEALLNIQVETAGKRKQSLKEVAQTVYVIEADEIRERGYRNIMEALDTLPGFQHLNNWYLDRLVIRGQILTLDKMLLLVDGQAMTMKSDSYNILNSGAPVDMLDIERIEVVMGPGSTLYGSGAFVGVVNIKTKTAETGALFNATASSTNERGFHLSLGADLGDAKLSVSGSYQDANGDKFKLYFPNGAPPGYQQTKVTANGYNTLNASRLSAKLETEKLSVRAQYSNAKIGWPSAIFETDLNDHGNYYRIKHNSIQAQYHDQLADTLSNEIRAYYNDSAGYWHGIYDGELYLPPDGEIYRGQYYGAEYRLEYQPSELVSVVGGVEYTRNYNVRSVDYVDDFENTSLFAQLEYQALSSLELEIGGRMERYSYRDTSEFMPQLGLVYTPDSNSSLKLSYGKGFIAPSTWVRELQSRTQQSDVGPELYQAYELTYQRTFSSWVSKLSAYYSTQSDNIQLAYNGNTPVNVFNSPNKERYKGVDWSTDLILSSRNSLRVSASYVSAEADQPGMETQNLAGVSDWMGGIAYRTEFQGSRVLTLEYKYASGPEGYPQLGSTHKVDASLLDNDLYGAQVRLTINNLFNERLETYSRNSQADVIPDRGRSVSLSVSVQF